MARTHQQQIDPVDAGFPSLKPKSSLYERYVPGLNATFNGLHETDPTTVLLQLCNGFINERDANYGDPLNFASSLICSLLDNANLDLCAIVPRYDREHEEATQKISCLLGFDSPTFKVRSFNLYSLMNDYSKHFLEYFTEHAQLSPVPIPVAGSSLYIWLLKQYLQHLLPLNDDDFAFVRSTHGNREQETSKKPTKEKVRTPFRLLRENVFANTADSMDSSYSFGTTYIRLFRFVELLVTNYATTSIKPSPAQIVSLKRTFDFLLAETGDHELEKFKSKLRANRQFPQVMYAYFKEMLSNLSLDQTFVCCFDILITLLYPGDSVFGNNNKLKIFKRFATEHFVRLIPVVVDRICNSDIRVLIQLDILQFFVVRLMNPNFIKMLCDLRFSAVDYLKPIQAKLKAATDVPQVNNSFVSRWSSFLNDFMDSNEEKNASTYLTIVNDRIRLLHATYPPSEFADRQNEDTHMDVGNVSDGTINSTLTRNPRSSIPDHIVDTWTNMYYLTPTGRDQVTHKLARFDFSQYSGQIAAAEGRRRWENPWLAAKLSEIAVRWSRHPLIRSLRRYSTNPFVRPITSVILQPKSPPCNVPVYRKDVPRRPATLNLRIFASYPVLAFLLFISWLLVSNLFGSFY
ncbi:hypothetical protein M3Y94_00482300 [Aphelenchoides besseyi]|nr:hypothetical protein M3Y94_00482300 [Aphelenchoides besseyi]